MQYFSTDFTDRSYFNIVKTIVEGIYAHNFDLKNFQFYFCADNEVNAKAHYDKENNYDFLTLNTGTIIEIVTLLKTAFAQKNILRKFGKPDKEQNMIYKGKYIFENNKHELIFSARNTIIDPCREELSLYAALLALRFISTHEIGHIVNGHTRLLNTLYANSKIHMRMEQENNNRQYCLDIMTLEMDADETAATHSIDNILMLYEKEQKNLKEMQIFSIEDLFELWGFSIACIFLRFESMSKTSYTLESCYLPNEARYLLTIDAARQTLLSYIRNKLISYTVDVETYNKAVTNGLLEAEKFFQLYGGDLAFTKSLPNNHGKFNLFFKVVNDNWDKKMRPFLKQYSNNRIVLFSEEETERAIKDMKKNLNFN